jgi:putative transposase
MRKPYPSDLTDAQWALIEPLIPTPGVGRPRKIDTREVVNAIFYLNRSGCQWDMLPHDLPAKSTVYDHFAQWRDDGTWQGIMDALRRQVRVAEGREPSPRGPRWAASGGTTGARRSAAASGTSSSTRWG